MTGPLASVVVPAHDEADTIATTLGVLLAEAEPGEFEVVVVANGCSDDTAARARSVPEVHVEELDAASKIAALRHGDEVATTFPRIYLDGDVALTTAAARALAAALEGPEPRAAGVPGRLETSGSTRPARWYYDFRQRLPVFHHGIIGAGVYALNEAGRARFGTWPDVLGDDQFIRRQFAADARVTVPGHTTTVEVAEDLATVVRRQVRVRRGNRQLTAGGDTHDSLDAPEAGIPVAVRDALRSPAGWPGLATWTAVQALVRARSRWGRGAGDWAVARGDDDPADATRSP